MNIIVKSLFVKFNKIIILLLNQHRLNPEYKKDNAKHKPIGTYNIYIILNIVGIIILPSYIHIYILLNLII